MIRTLCIEGNSLASVYAIGALDFMYRNGTLCNLKHIYCYSFGALIASSFCVHGSFTNLLTDLQTRSLWWKCLRLQALVKIAVLCPRFRRCNNEILRSALSEVLPDDVTTLGDLQRRSGICVHVLVCCSSSLTTRIFSSNKHSEYKLLDILVATCALPFIFEPVEIRGQSYIDGGVYSGMSHVCTHSKGCEMLLVGRAQLVWFHYSLNCFEQLWSTLLAVQKSKMAKRSRGIHMLNMPQCYSVMLHAQASSMERMYYTGASIACAEMVLHRIVGVTTARMSCCGMTAYAALIELPASKEHMAMVDTLRTAGITVLHQRQSDITWQRPFFHCGLTSIVWA